MNHTPETEADPPCAAGLDGLCRSHGTCDLVRHLVRDLEQLLAQSRADQAAFKKQAEKLSRAISDHHRQRADDRCWLDDCALYEAAGLPPGDNRVGDKDAMLANCARYIDRRCTGGHWPSYADLERRIAELGVKIHQVECNKIASLGKIRRQYEGRYNELRAAVWDSSNQPLGADCWHAISHEETVKHARGQVATLEADISAAEKARADAAAAQCLLASLVNLVLRDGGRAAATLGVGPDLTRRAAEALELQQERAGRAEAELADLRRRHAATLDERARLAGWLRLLWENRGPMNSSEEFEISEFLTRSQSERAKQN